MLDKELISGGALRQLVTPTGVGQQPGWACEHVWAPLWRELRVRIRRGQ